VISPPGEQLTGKVGLGAIVILAGYLVLDSQPVGIFKILETYGDTTSWALLIAVPTIVVSYVLGILSIDVAQVLLGRLSVFRSVDEGRDLLVVGSSPDILQARYSEVIRRAELLQGAVIAFLMLACGCLIDRENFGNGFLGWTVVVIAVVLAVLSGVFAARAARGAKALVLTVSAASLRSQPQG
jgi:hypothetical protein